MKKSKVLLIIILCIFIFLILDKMRISMEITTLSKPEVVDSKESIQNLIDYINNLELSKDDIDDISEKGKNITDAIKGKTAFKEFKLKEILSIYKNFNSIANKLNLKIDFSIKNGDFTLKDKFDGNNLFSGNIGNVKKYFKEIKENTDITTLDTFSSILGKDILDKVNEIMSEDTNYDIISNQEINNDQVSNYEENNIATKDKEIDETNTTINDIELLDEEKNLNSENSVFTNNKSNFDMILPITILIVAFFIIIVSYIKFK